MLRWGLVTFNFFRFSQSGMYIDFILKQFVEYIVRTLLICTSLFFGEKYLIEYLTKKTIDSLVYNSNRLIQSSNFNFQIFFISVLSSMLYFFCLIICLMWGIF